MQEIGILDRDLLEYPERQRLEQSFMDKSEVERNTLARKYFDKNTWWYLTSEEVIKISKKERL